MSVVAIDDLFVKFNPEPVWPSSCMVGWQRLSACFHCFPINLGSWLRCQLSSPGCPATRASKREVFLTNYRPRVGVVVVVSKLSHLISCLPPVVSPLTSGYLTAKTNCLAEKTHNSPCTLLIYTRLVRTCKYGKSIWTVWCHLYTLYPSLTAQKRHYLNLFCVIDFIFLFCYTSSFWEKGKFESYSCLMHLFFNKLDILTEKCIRRPDYVLFMLLRKSECKN